MNYTVFAPDLSKNLTISQKQFIILSFCFFNNLLLPSIFSSISKKPAAMIFNILVTGNLCCSY